MDEKYIQKIVENEQRSKSNTYRLDKLEKEIENQRELVVSVKEIATEVKHMREDVNDMNKRLKEVEEKPKKQWNAMVSQVISLIIGGIVGYLFLKLGL